MFQNSIIKPHPVKTSILANWIVWVASGPVRDAHCSLSNPAGNPDSESLITLQSVSFLASSLALWHPEVHQC